MSHCMMMGLPESGKTTLLNALEGDCSLPVYRPSRDGVQKREIEGTQWYDTSGDARFRGIVSRYIEGMQTLDVVFFCVNLGKPELPQMSDEVEACLKSACARTPKPRLILVGTAAKGTRLVNAEALNELAAVCGFDEVIETDVEAPDTLQQLHAHVNDARVRCEAASVEEARRRMLVDFDALCVQLHNSLLRTAVLRLKDALSQSSPTQIQSVSSTLGALLDGLRVSASDTPQRMNAFTSACYMAIGRAHPSLSSCIARAVVAVLIGVACAALAGAVGGMIGALLGAWSGPGTFFAALAGAGAAAAIAVCACACAFGFGATSLSAWYFFRPKPAPVTQAVIDAAQDASRCTQPVFRDITREDYIVPDAFT